MVRLRRLFQSLNESAKAHPSLFFKRVAYVGVILIGISFTLNIAFGSRGSIQFYLFVIGLIVWGLGFTLMGGLAGVECEAWWEH
jgi:4-hydroxybenzoate polyprenyltransferase